MQKKILIIIGTRPELIKVFPIIRELQKRNYKQFKIVSTGQHKELLAPYWRIFELQPDYELDILIENQNLSNLTANALLKLQTLLSNIEQEFKPDIIISQGDTTTVMAASIVSFYNGIQFAHIEAGLRSFDLQHPFPEEFNRKVSSIISNYHFAPTEKSKENLLSEGISSNKIHVVGNTVIDTLRYFIESNQIEKHEYSVEELRKINNKTVLITCHRRENHLKINDLIEAVEQLAEENPKFTFVWPVHPNPNVKNAVLDSSLSQKSNILITNPLDYLDLIKVMSNSIVVISDSGGIQEEAPTFKVPVLILRDTTERPEAVELGYSKLIGLSKESLLESFYQVIENKEIEIGANPYGDGFSSSRIINQIIENN